MPSCVAVQIALVDLLQSWGIACAAVASHSSGEIAAAYAAGVISKDEALGIAYSRGQFAMSGGGSMTAVALGPADAQEYIARVASGRLVVACMNSPTSTTVSGDVPALEELESFLQADGIFSRREAWCRLLVADYGRPGSLTQRSTGPGSLGQGHGQPSPVRRGFPAYVLGRPKFANAGGS